MKSVRAEWLLRQHQRMIKEGFLPVEVVVESEDENAYIVNVDCYVCRHRDLKGIIRWKNDRTGKERYTGLTCYERVVDRLNLVEERKRILVWVARNRSRFKGKGPVSLDQAELTRLLSYKRPLSSAYGGRWKDAVADIWKDRAEFPMSKFELGLLKTLHDRRGKFWVPSSPTARQRRFLNELLVKYWNWRRRKDLSAPPRRLLGARRRREGGSNPGARI